MGRFFGLQKFQIFFGVLNFPVDTGSKSTYEENIRAPPPPPPETSKRGSWSMRNLCPKKGLIILTISLLYTLGKWRS